MPKTKYNQTTSTGQDVTYNNVYQEQYLEFKLEKAVHMLLKKIDKLEDKIRKIEINCSCQ